MLQAPVDVPHPKPPRHRPARSGVLAFVACALILLAPPALAAAFGFDDVSAEAQTLAQSPWRKPPPLDARRANLEYDEYRKLRHRPDRSLWRSQKLPFQMQFFTTGRTNVRALRLNEIVDGKAQPLIVRNADFEFEGVLNEPSQAAAPIAGWRVTYPMHRPDLQDEVAAFLGASYFRAVGKAQRYGLSARGAGDRHRRRRGRGVSRLHGVLVRAARSPTRATLTFYALLDGPRVTGAYRFVVTPGITDHGRRAGAPVPARAGGHARHRAADQHVPARREPASASNDFRPEVHDSDGLQIETGNGEWIWRPLTNPRRHLRHLVHPAVARAASA